MFQHLKLTCFQLKLAAQVAGKLTPKVDKLTPKVGKLAGQVAGKLPPQIGKLPAMGGTGDHELSS